MLIPYPAQYSQYFFYSILLKDLERQQWVRQNSPEKKKDFGDEIKLFI